jgi:hypothetical protein
MTKPSDVLTHLKAGCRDRQTTEEAVTLIEGQAAEIKRLREALGVFANDQNWLNVTNTPEDRANGWEDIPDWRWIFCSDGPDDDPRESPSAFARQALEAGK